MGLKTRLLESSAEELLLVTPEGKLRAQDGRKTNGRTEHGGLFQKRATRRGSRMGVHDDGDKAPLRRDRVKLAHQRKLKRELILGRGPRVRAS